MPAKGFQRLPFLCKGFAIGIEECARIRCMNTATKLVTSALSHCLFLLGLFLLGGCSTLQSDFEEPTVQMVGLRMAPSDDSLPRFEIDLRVINPNRSEIKLAGASYSISLDNFELVKGVASDLPVVPAYGEAQFTLPASLSLMQGFRLITTLANEPRDSIRYEMKAKLDTGVFTPSIRISEEGEISLSTLKATRGTMK